MDTDQVLDGYVTCALWSELDQSDENTGGEPLENGRWKYLTTYTRER